MMIAMVNMIVMMDDHVIVMRRAAGMAGGMVNMWAPVTMMVGM